MDLEQLKNYIYNIIIILMLINGVIINIKIFIYLIKGKRNKKSNKIKKVNKMNKRK